jgi:hypothetical protein
VTTFPTRTTGTTAGRLPRASGARQASGWAFASVAVTSFGAGPFVEAAVGHRVDLVQAGLWIVSYTAFAVYALRATIQHSGS